MALKRPRQDERFVSGGELAVDGTVKGAGIGPGGLKRIVIEILQEGETVTRSALATEALGATFDLLK